MCTDAVKVCYVWVQNPVENLVNSIDLPFPKTPEGCPMKDHKPVFYMGDIRNPDQTQYPRPKIKTSRFTANSSLLKRA